MFASELVTAILPSIVSIVAIIVPAVLSIKTKRLDITEKESEHRRETIYQYYADFCTGFARYSAGIDAVKSATLVKESAYKLAGFCPEYCASELLAFASKFEGAGNPGSDSLREGFEACLKHLREEVIKE